MNEIIFQLSHLVISELKPAVIAFGFKLFRFQSENKGGLPEEITSHQKHAMLTSVLQPVTITKLIHPRAEYMIQLLLDNLANRSMYSQINLRDRIKKHVSLLYEMDMICNLCDAGTLAAVYGAAIQALIKHGSFKIADVTDVVTVPAAKEEKAKVDEKTDLTDSLDGTLTSQERLSEYGIQKDFKKEGDVSTVLKSSEALMALRATLTADMTLTCRTSSL